MEILVVLIIVGMISAILAQALAQVFQLEARFGSELAKAGEGVMLVDWFRQSVHGIQPDAPEGSHAFRGEQTKFSALTTNSLADIQGAPTPIEWSIRTNGPDGQTMLFYAEAGTAAPLLAWTGSGRFTYLDAQGNTHKQWPPGMGAWPQIPAAIILEKGDERIMASPRGPGHPKPRPADLFKTEQP